MRFILFIFLIFFGSRVFAIEEEMSPLDKLIKEAEKKELNFIASNGKLTFLLWDNPYKRIPSDFYKLSNHELVLASEKRDYKVLKKLMRIAKKKGFLIFAKKGGRVYLVKNNILEPISPNEYEAYFAIETKTLKAESDLWQKVIFLNPLVPDWHFKKIDVALKTVDNSVEASSYPYFSWSPYYRFYGFHGGMMGNIGGNLVQTTKENFISFDLNVNLFYFYPLKHFSPAIYGGIGHQTWLGKGSSYFLYQVGIGGFFEPFYKVQEVFLTFGKLKRPSNRPEVSELKLGVGILLPD